MGHGVSSQQGLKKDMVRGSRGRWERERGFAVAMFEEYIHVMVFVVL
jgi:hypothetical protein